MGLHNRVGPRGDKYHPLIKSIIEKFKLDTAEVDKLIEEDMVRKEEHHQKKEAMRKEETLEDLNKAVADGKINEEQKEKILTKLEEMRADRPQRMDFAEMSRLTPEERQAKREEMRNEREKRRQDFEAWEQELGVKLSDILEFRGPGGLHGHGGRHPRHGRRF